MAGTILCCEVIQTAAGQVPESLKRAQNFLNSFDIKIEGSFSFGLQGGVKFGVGKATLNGYSEKFASVAVGTTKDGIEATGQLFNFRGETKLSNNGKVTNKIDNKGLIESKAEIGAELGVKGQLNVGLSGEASFNSDNHGNKSDGKASAQVGPTGEVVENSGLKTAKGIEVNDRGNIKEKPQSTSFTFGEALIGGWEVKVEITKRQQ